MVIDWSILESSALSGMSKLYALGGIYLIVAIVAYVTVSSLESLAISYDLPVSTSVNAMYEIATAGIFWTIGVFIGVGMINYLYPNSSFLVEGAAIVGLFAVVLGEYTLWRGRLGNSQSANH